MNQTESIVLCVAIAWVSYLIGRNGAKPTTASATEAPPDGMAWLGSWYTP